MKKKYEFNKLSKSEISSFLVESARIAEYQLSIVDEIMSISDSLRNNFNEVVSQFNDLENNSKKFKVA